MNGLTPGIFYDDDDDLFLTFALDTVKSNY
jgi:hypothetical protein